ncbi:MAG: helix-turn-helix domain-containing protein [Oscillospiraceae bacterium]|nr:helix-turn-helix domain-containing protein [Oscillospiraceae bacterium]
MQYNDFSDLPFTISVKDLMELLGVSHNTAYNLVRSGAIRSYRIGRQIRIRKSDLQAYMDRHIADY